MALALALTVLALCLAGAPALAGPAADGDEPPNGLPTGPLTESPVRLAQRQAFLAAERLLTRDGGVADRTAYRALALTLGGYPLYPYLQARNLRQRLAAGVAEAKQLDDEVGAFLQRYDGLPPADRLRAAWVEHLAAARRWAQLLRVLPDGIGDARPECWRRRALLHSGRVDEALQGIEKVWLVGRSQPDNCDPLFARWRERGGFTAERVWRRFELAIDNGEERLATYLQRLLPAGRRALASLWLAVYRRPERVLDAGRFDGGNAEHLELIMRGVYRWARRDSVAAAAAWDRLLGRYRFPAGGSRDRLERRLALYVAGRGDPSAARRLATLPASAVDEQVEEWRVREALARHDWPAVSRSVDRMAPAGRASPRWRYWRARALEALGDRQNARSAYRQLVGMRDYHAFLAADRLGVDYQMRHSPLQAPDEMTLARLPALQRAYEFWRLDRLPQARAEWRLAERGFDTAQQRAAAKLAQRWGWHDRAIAAAAKARDWDDLTLRFPLPYRQAVATYSREHAVDPAWIYAVMRQESLFQSDIRSGAGALGLMQLLPGTGRRIAHALGAPRPAANDLLRIDTNIRYGAYYLRQTMDDLQSNPLLATAAYNAGPRRVVAWLPRHTSVAADVWAETIPFRETRQYVQRVMEYAAVYRWRLQQPQARLSRAMGQILPVREDTGNAG